jgi:response regulator RpfG family c-di-GMP phosphodiesterase
MTGTRKKILYVDDEMINLELFRLSFRSDFDIVLAASGHEGLKKFENEAFDIVISDLKMPGMNGVEMIQEIKKLRPDFPCILLTAFMDPDAMIKAINEALVFKYVLKPWKLAELKQIIEDAIRSKDVK